MKKVVLMLALAGSACVMPADDETARTGPERIAETSAALQSDVSRIDPEAAQWLAENIPQWDVYLGGKGHDLHPGKHPWSSFTNVYYDDPAGSDLFAPIILVRRGDSEHPERWIQLSLGQHWMKGDRYFDELITCGTLTVMDLLVIVGELGKHADSYVEPRPIHVLAAATPQALRELRGRSRATCKDPNPPKLHTFAGKEDGPYGPPLPPGWVEGPDSHTNGPAPVGSNDGKGRPPDVTSDRPSLSLVPPDPAPPRTAEQNGVGPGDPKAKPSPYDGSYKARPGERKETFKCDGEVFYGYRAGCLDLSNVSLSMKWFVQGGLWLERASEKTEDVRKSFQDKLINNGTKEDCERHCRYLGYAEFAVIIAIIPTACFLITKSPSCANAANTNAATQIGASVVANGTLSTVAQNEATAECVKHVCEGK